MIAPLLFVLLQAAPAIPADLAAELKSIKAELADAQRSEKAFAVERAAIEKEAAHITDTEYLLERGITTLENERLAVDKDGAALLADAKKQNAEAAIVTGLIADYNRRCTGTFEESYYNACMAEKGTLAARAEATRAWAVRLEAWRDRLLSKRAALQKQADTLDEINATLLRDQNALEDRRDALKKHLDNLEQQKKRLNDRQTGALAALAKVNAVSQDCAEIAKKITTDSCKPVGDPSDPANWNTPCEQAARCLSRAFDGAR